MDSSVSLSSSALDQLNTSEARALHDISDSLSACGVGRIIDLPRIVVVGEQSAGKSSVLEAITRVRFPVEGGLCTRFATELVLRPAEKTSVDVSVKFADKTKPSKSFHRKDFKDEDLPDIVDKAKSHMGFSGDESTRFSKDLLRLEIRGPRMYPLSLVDLPGLFHNLTETQTASDRDLVSDLVHSYMQQRNSIILVVITANNQLASHMALNKVKAVDPQGLRTIGVITKPDLVRPGFSDEKMYVRVVKNQEAANRLQLGWHVLRNRAEDEASLEKRDGIEERFFNNGVWASIPTEDRGVESLRRKLSRVLYNHIRNGLPGVVADIETNMRDRQEELERLGKPRATPEDMRSFLLGIASEFQRLARDAINGSYNDPFFGGLDDERHKLRAQLRNFNRAFDYVLRNKGSKQVIIKKSSVERRTKPVPPYLVDFFKINPYNFPDPPIIQKETLKQQLQNQAAANQGKEFPGSPNKDLAVQLFKEQAEPWKNIAEHHIDSVMLVTKAVVDEIFEHIVGMSAMSSTTEAILATCVDPFFEDRQKILGDKLAELLKPYKEGYALPTDAEFFERYSKRSDDELADRVHSILRDRYPDAFNPGTERTLDGTVIKDAIANAQPPSDDEFGVGKVVDMMIVYYHMCQRTFIDNVLNLAIESCLVRHIPEILTPKIVDSMNLERLRELAAESETTTARRQILQDELKVLRQGLSQCRRYRPRPVTALPTRVSERDEKQTEESRTPPQSQKPLPKQSTPDTDKASITADKPVSLSNSLAMVASVSDSNSTSSATPHQGLISSNRPTSTASSEALFANTQKSSLSASTQSAFGNSSVAAPSNAANGGFGSNTTTPLFKFATETPPVTKSSNSPPKLFGGGNTATSPRFGMPGSTQAPSKQQTGLFGSSPSTF